MLSAKFHNSRWIKEIVIALYTDGKGIGKATILSYIDHNDNNY